MFNDQYSLTQAVLDGRKTQTRRIAYQEPFKYYCNSGFYTEGKDKGKLAINDGNEIVAKSTYKIGEVVAIAQRYIHLALNEEFYRLCGIHGMPLECIKYEKGCYNKMFVKADLMPHRIRITNIRVERLQDISTEDCMKEGSSVATSKALTMLFHTMPQMIVLRRNGGTELLSKHTRCSAASSISTGVSILSFSFTISF